MKILDSLQQTIIKLKYNFLFPQSEYSTDVFPFVTTNGIPQDLEFGNFIKEFNDSNLKSLLYKQMQNLADELNTVKKNKLKLFSLLEYILELSEKKTLLQECYIFLQQPSK